MTKHSALAQKMGDTYHYYVAINLLLENNEWYKCLIEKHGDIVLLDDQGYQIINIEVKHHNELKELKIHDEEFQKTLFNWFNILDKFSNTTQLLLMTSSTISKENILFHWNEFNENKKYQTLSSNIKKKNEEYYSNVKKYFFSINKNVDELKMLLNKVEINHSLPNILSIKDVIGKQNYFRIFKDDGVKIAKVIDELYGLIGRGLQDKDTWEITKNEFDNKLKEITNLVQEKLLRTDNDIVHNSDDIILNDYRDKQFINKLKNIEFKEDIFELAIDDYAKTITELSERLNLSSSLEYEERLNTYNSSLIKLVNQTKIEYKYKPSLTNLDKSQSSYFQIMNASKIPFMPEEFDDKTTFFQKGYLHILADDEENPEILCWSVVPKELL